MVRNIEGVRRFERGWLDRLCGHINVIGTAKASSHNRALLALSVDGEAGFQVIMESCRSMLTSVTYADWRGIFEQGKGEA